jgi:hypothetical protein
MVPDFVVWRADGSGAALVVQIGGVVPGEPSCDPGLGAWGQRQLVAYLAKVDGRHALVVRAADSYFLRHEPGAEGGQTLRVVGRVPTAALFGAAPPAGTSPGGELLDHRVKAWLERLAQAGAEALPGDEAVRGAIPSEVVDAASGGRVVWELVEECKRRKASGGPRYTSQEVQATLRALEEEWARTGGFDEEYMHAFLDRLRSGERR